MPFGIDKSVFWVVLVVKHYFLHDGLNVGIEGGVDMEAPPADGQSGVVGSLVQAGFHQGVDPMGVDHGVGVVRIGPALAFGHVQDDLFIDGLLVFRVADKTKVEHHRKDVVPPVNGRFHVVGIGGVVHWRVGDSGQQGRFGQSQFADRLAKVSLGGGFHAVSAVVVKGHVVDVKFKDFLFAVAALDLYRDVKLLNLAGKFLFTGEIGLLGYLLGNGAAPLTAPAHQVGVHCPGYAPEVKTGMVKEALIFRRQECVPQVVRDILHFYRDPILSVVNFSD